MNPLPKPQMVSPSTPSPQQSNWTVQSFAQAVRQQTPNGIASDGIPYAKMTDADLTKRIVDKYPVYQNQISDYGKASFHNVAQNLQQLPGQLKDLAGKVAPTAGAIAGGIGGGLLGGAVASPTIAGIPAGVLAGGAAGAAVGGAAGEALSEKIRGENLSPKDIATTGLEYGALQAVGGPVLSIAGKTIMKGGEVLAKAVIPRSTQEAGLLQAYRSGNTFLQRIGAALGFDTKAATSKIPTTMGGTAFEKGLMGRETDIGIHAKRAAGTLWNKLVAPALNESKVKVNMPSFFLDLEKKIVAQNPELGRQKDLLNALEALKADYAGVGDVPLAQLQKFKEGWAKFVPEKAYRGQPIGGAYRDLTNMAAGDARQVIYDTLGPEIKQAYFDYGNLQGLQELGKTAMTGAGLKGGAGKFLHSLWEMATVPIGTVGGQTLYKVGKGIEFLGAPGATTLRMLLGIPLGFGTTSSETPPPSSPSTTGQSQPSSSPPQTSGAGG